MFSDNGLKVWAGVLLCAVVLCNCAVLGGTLHLKDGKEWEDISDTPEGRRLMAVAKFKQLINSGEAESALDELIKLKQAHPEIAGPDFDKFVEGEFLYADGKWFKAIRKYDELLDGWPQSWLKSTALERNFSIALAFLNGEKRKILGMIKLSAFDEGETIMHRVADRAGNDAPIAKRALISLAKAYQSKGDFLDAHEVWWEVHDRWPTGATGRMALLEMAQSVHSAYTTPDYEDTGLISAETYYTNFKLRYPELVEENEIDEKLAQVKEQLAYKQYLIGVYYDRTGSPEAAQFYYHEVTENEGWAGTEAVKMAQARIDVAETGMKKRETNPKKFGRALFDASNAFVDSWYGAKYLTGGKSKK
jgi:outer membrane protein assembly factor BamD (BamD/ComL family)